MNKIDNNIPMNKSLGYILLFSENTLSLLIIIINFHLLSIVGLLKVLLGELLLV